MDPVAAKLRMMNESIRCLVLGVLSLIPIIGVGCAVFALWYSYSARRREKFFWNPAKAQRIIGLVCAALGALVWSGVDTYLIYSITNH
jgi:hypothetical protein